MLKNIRNIVISMLSLVLLSYFLILNLNFCFISFPRYIAIDSSYGNGWRSTEKQEYDGAIVEMENFENSGDYQEWLVTSGTTITGKFVRLIIWIIEISLYVFFFSALFFNSKVFYRKFKIQKR